MRTWPPDGSRKKWGHHINFRIVGIALSLVIGEGRGEGEDPKSPLPFIPSHEGRGNKIKVIDNQHNKGDQNKGDRQPTE